MTSRGLSLTARLAAGLAGALAIAALVYVLSPGRPATPPLAGWMQNFTPVAEPPPAPATSFTGQHGAAARLSDYRGRVVLVNFWATWCGPCIRELPSLARLRARINPEGAEVLAVSLDRRGWAVIAPFLKRVDTGDMPVFHDAGAATARGLKIGGLPETVLFGRDGRELGRLKGPAEWDSDEAVALIRYYLGN